MSGQLLTKKESLRKQRRDLRNKAIAKAKVYYEAQAPIDPLLQAEIWYYFVDRFEQLFLSEDPHLRAVDIGDDIHSFDNYKNPNGRQLPTWRIW